MSTADNWGTEPEERARPFPCDHLIAGATVAYYRGVTIDARPQTVFRWLCQMRVAPYSYDWIDNFGRRSPQFLTPGVERLAIGQTVMRIFELVDFVPDEHLTLRLKPADFWNLVEELAVGYVVVPTAAGSSRLLVKLLIRYRSGALGWLMRLGLPWGDLVMMRRQLLNLKALAERTERETRGGNAGTR
jgi:hypothetical protein